MRIGLAAPGAPAPEAECFAADGRSAERVERERGAQPGRCVAAAALPDDSSLAELLRVGLVRASSAPDGLVVRVGLVRAGSARDGCWVARLRLRRTIRFAPEGSARTIRLRPSCFGSAWCGLVRRGTVVGLRFEADDPFAPAPLPDDSSLADLVRVGLVPAGSAWDGCLVALQADDPFALAPLPDDSSPAEVVSGRPGAGWFGAGRLFGCAWGGRSVRAGGSAGRLFGVGSGRLFGAGGLLGAGRFGCAGFAPGRSFAAGGLAGRFAG